MARTNDYCCEMMQIFSTLKCDLHKWIYDCPDVLIEKGNSRKKYKILIHDGGSSGIIIKYCPWCGKKLS
jgi:hypothetical protein